MTDRCDSFYWQYRCSGNLGHAGEHHTLGDDCTEYRWIATTKRLIWVNGVFDVLHLGHVRLLNFARSLGDRLVVGINSDESVRRLKGENRPIFDEKMRAEMLRELRCIDEIDIFSEDTPVEAIRRRGALWAIVKGEEYASVEFPERRIFPSTQFFFYDSGLNSRSSRLIR